MEREVIAFPQVPLRGTQRLSEVRPLRGLSFGGLQSLKHALEKAGINLKQLLNISALLRMEGWEF